MQKRYFVDEELKKKCLKAYVRSKPKYIRWYRVSIFFESLGFIILIGSVVLSAFGGEFSIVNFAVGVALGFFFSLFPFGIGQSIGIKAMKEYGFPFTKMEKEYLMITDDGVEFGYRDTDSKWEESMDIYSISADAITKTYLDGEVFTIFGEGQVIPYDDITTKRVNKLYSPRRYYWNTPFHILLAFDEREEIVERINEMKKN